MKYRIIKLIKKFTLINRNQIPKKLIERLLLSHILKMFLK